MKVHEAKKLYGQLWTTEQLKEDFEVLGFAYYMCIVRRKSDGVKGSLDFHEIGGTRMYHSFSEDK